jgi:Glycosyl transferases group 1/Glycosyl transferase family 2
MASILQQQDSAPHLTDNVEASGRALPRELSEFQDYHAGETILVCGCGSSLSQIVAPERFVTIGVNDVGRLFQPDYLVVLNPLHQFRGDRARYVEESRASAIFTQLQLAISHPHIVRFRLGTRGGVSFNNPQVLHYTRNSPYLALCLAVHMGAKRVGLIGVDFTDHHFFGQTGRHPLTGEFAQIEREYKHLAESCRQMGVEVVNLSQESRLTAFPKMSPMDFASTSMLNSQEDAQAQGRKVFFVNYKFLSCGDVFKDGLNHAAEDLKVEHADAYWDDPGLEEKVKEFSPELLFVVHGRKFVRRWGRAFKDYKSAVWLLDEPYEVDDTAKFSQHFNSVFINDPGTLDRHPRAHYLPVCYDPRHHFYQPGVERKYLTGFIGGYNRQREEFLEQLSQRGLLSYVIGGPWRKPSVNALCLSGNIPATETANLYRETKIVLNIFRITHHYNRAGIPATSLNPRVYEAAQCGALVISEKRAEMENICPEMPVFETTDELVKTVEELVADPARFERVRRACVRQLAAHTYARRLSTVLSIALDQREADAPRSLMSFAKNTPQPPAAPQPPARVEVEPLPETLAAHWEYHGDVARFGADGVIVMSKAMDEGAGTEQGLAGKLSHRNVALSFEVLLENGACFIAKIHQQSAENQHSNSYHLLSRGAQGYIARHNHVLRSVAMHCGAWMPVKMVYHNKIVALHVNGEIVCRASDDTLQEGYCFLGLKGGTVRLRNIKVEESTLEEIGHAAVPAHRILYDARSESQPLLSIITTVYDRVQCLEHCLRSVRELHFQDYEQIVVADYPPPLVLAQLLAITEGHGQAHGKLLFANLNRRYNDWGINPAAVGLHLARGKYVCFLSDDNGYMPDHAGPLIEALDNDAKLGFVYSSCLYDGRLTLQSSPPRFGRIDLGQPFFRKELFDIHLDGTLPFTEAAWDWRMIQALMRKGVRWRHINRPTFIFRLAKYPHLIPAAG